MRRTNFLWTLGSRTADKFGYSYGIPVVVEHNMRKRDIISYLTIGMRIDCVRMFGFDIDTWCNDPGKYEIPLGDFEKLKEIGALASDAVNEFNPCVLFELWVRLLGIVRKDIRIRRYEPVTIGSSWGRGFLADV